MKLEEITAIAQLIEKYPHFFMSEELFMYSNVPHYVPYIELICKRASNWLYQHKPFIKLRIPNKQGGAFCTAPEDMYSFSFSQIKMKFKQARFYTSMSFKPFETLSKPDQELYCPENYVQTAKDTIRKMDDFVHCMEQLACEYKIVKLKSNQ